MLGTIVRTSCRRLSVAEEARLASGAWICRSDGSMVVVDTAFRRARDSWERSVLVRGAWSGFFLSRPGGMVADGLSARWEDSPSHCRGVNGWMGGRVAEIFIGRRDEQEDMAGCNEIDSSSIYARK